MSPVLLALASLAASASGEAPFDLGFQVCKQGKISVLRLEEIATFETNPVDLRSFGMPLSAKVGDETLFLERENKAVRFYRIDRIVSPKSDIDIDLKLGVFESRPVLLWEETFKHRPARFGVMAIEGEKLTPKCEGTTGTPVIE